MSTQVILAEGPFMGETIAQLGKAKGRKTVSRHDLIEGYRSLIEDHRIIFNKRLKTIRQRDGQVAAEFEDGTTAIADCLIGCDGVHSKVREHLLGQEHPAAYPVNHDHWARVNLQLPHEQAQQYLPSKWTGFVPIICTKHRYFNIMPIHRGNTISVSFGFPGPDAPANIDHQLYPALWSQCDPEILHLVQVGLLIPVKQFAMRLLTSRPAVTQS